MGRQAYRDTLKLVFASFPLTLHVKKVDSIRYLRLAQQTPNFVRPRAFHTVQKSHEDKLFIQSPDHVILAFVKDQDVVRPEFSVDPIGPGKNTTTFNHDDVERGAGRVMFADSLTRFEHETNDAAVFINVQRLSIGMIVMIFQIV